MHSDQLAEATDRWVWVIRIAIIHISEYFPGLYCDGYIWTNLLLHHLFKNDPHRWLAASQTPHIILKKKKPLRVYMSVCLYMEVTRIIQK